MGCERRMTLPKTLEKSVTKALKSGYVPIPGYKVHGYKAEVNRAGFGFIAFMLYQDIPGKDERKFSQVTLSIADVLFDHGFLKALYGEEEDGNTSQDAYAIDITPAFKKHATQLALLESNKGRINYVGSTM